MRALLLSLLCCLPLTAMATEQPRVLLKTSHGDMTLELYPEKAPETVENFLDYVRSDFYTGTIFHRVIEDFMIQGGGFNAQLQQLDTRAPITNEADNGLSNKRGAVAMARTSAPHSATAQFFINTVNNPSLDHSDKTPRGWGYAVFGKVVDGMDTLDRIAALETRAQGPMRNLPVERVIIQDARIITDKGSKEAQTSKDNQ